MKTKSTVRAIAASGAVIGIAAAMLVGGASSASAKRATCMGLTATIVGSGTVKGTPGRDIIVLTGPGTVRSGGGNDIVCGSSKSDKLYGGAGDDMLMGLKGRDSLYGGPGTDTLVGGKGKDVLYDLGEVEDERNPGSGSELEAGDDHGNHTGDHSHH